MARLLERPLVMCEPLAALDAIVVLGAPLGPGDALSPVLAERVAAAAALWHAGGGRLVVATGGVTRGAQRAEADVMAAALGERGVPDVLVECASQTTRENARPRLGSARLVELGARWTTRCGEPHNARDSLMAALAWTMTKRASLSARCSRSVPTQMSPSSR